MDNPNVDTRTVETTIGFIFECLDCGMNCGDRGWFEEDVTEDGIIRTLRCDKYLICGNCLSVFSSTER